MAMKESLVKKNKQKNTHTNKQGHPLSRILLCKTLVREGLLSERCEVGQSFADSTAVIRKKLTASSPISLSSFFSFYYFCFTRRFVTNRDSSVWCFGGGYIFSTAEEKNSNNSWGGLFHLSQSADLYPRWVDPPPSLSKVGRTTTTTSKLLGGGGGVVVRRRRQRNWRGY